MAPLIMVLQAGRGALFSHWREREREREERKKRGKGKGDGHGDERVENGDALDTAGEDNEDAHEEAHEEHKLHEIDADAQRGSILQGGNDPGDAWRGVRVRERERKGAEPKREKEQPMYREVVAVQLLRLNQPMPTNPRIEAGIREPLGPKLERRTCRQTQKRHTQTHTHKQTKTNIKHTCVRGMVKKRATQSRERGGGKRTRPHNVGASTRYQSRRQTNGNAQAKKQREKRGIERGRKGKRRK